MDKTIVQIIAEVSGLTIDFVKRHSESNVIKLPIPLVCEIVKTATKQAFIAGRNYKNMGDDFIMWTYSDFDEYLNKLEESKNKDKKSLSITDHFKKYIGENDTLSDAIRRSNDINGLHYWLKKYIKKLEVKNGIHISG